MQEGLSLGSEPRGHGRSHLLGPCRGTSQRVLTSAPPPISFLSASLQESSPGAQSFSLTGTLSCSSLQVHKLFLSVQIWPQHSCWTPSLKSADLFQGLESRAF